MGGIRNQAPSKRSPIYADQARMLVLLANELIQVRQERPNGSTDDFQATPEYQRFVLGMYACGVVCRDLEPLKAEWSTRELEDAPWSAVRHWLHTLARSERWNFGWSSPIMAAIDDGRLALVMRRIEGGEFAEPEVIVDEVSLTHDALG